MNEPVNSFMPSRPIPSSTARHPRGLLRRGGLRQLHFGRQINGMTALGKDAAGKKDIGAGDFTRT